MFYYVWEYIKENNHHLNDGYTEILAYMYIILHIYNVIQCYITSISLTGSKDDLV